MIPLLHTGSEWGWHLHPDVILFCVALGGSYLYVVTQLRERMSDAGRVRRSQALLFLAGVLAIYIASSSPIHDIAEKQLLSVHMVQHFIYTMVAAPLLLAGTPGWVVSWCVRGPRVRAVADFVTRPVMAFAVFNAVLVLTHLPRVVELSLQAHPFHFAVHAVLLVSAVLMWWPVLSNTPELPRSSYPVQMAYLFLQSVLPAVVASFVTFSESPVYNFYAKSPPLWGLSPLEDQQIAGGVMKLLGTTVLWSFMGLAFYRWYQRDQADAAEGDNWGEIEEELDRMGLTSRR
ncbi:MAG: cytochrome c oxidase assembly protein [Dehalococcoidia bacterium]